MIPNSEALYPDLPYHTFSLRFICFHNIYILIQIKKAKIIKMKDGILPRHGWERNASWNSSHLRIFYFQKKKLRIFNSIRVYIVLIEVPNQNRDSHAIAFSWSITHFSREPKHDHDFSFSWPRSQGTGKGKRNYRLRGTSSCHPTCPILDDRC